MNWFLLALVAMFSFTMVFLLSKRAMELGLKSEIVTLYIFLLASIFLFIYLSSTRVSLTLTKYGFWILLLTALFSAIGNLFLFKSIQVSPNPGYSLAVSGMHILLVAVASIFVFKSEFTLIKRIGVILTVAGIILLGL